MSEIWSIEEEGRRLGLRFVAVKAEKKIGQAKFARDFEFPGGKSMVNQNISGNRSMTIIGATIYAQFFNCNLSEISPRIAKDVSAIAAATSQPAKEAEKRVENETPGESRSLKDATPSAVVIARLYDMIPTDDQIRRAKAFNAATDAIIAVIESLGSSAPALQGLKKQAV